MMPTREGNYGLETGFPMSGHSNAAARKLGVVGPVLSQANDGRMAGARRRGSSWVINADEGPRGRGGGSVQVERIRFTGGPAPLPPPEDSAGAPPAGQGGESGDGGQQQGAGSGGDGDS